MHNPTILIKSNALSLTTPSTLTFQSIYVPTTPYFKKLSNPSRQEPKGTVTTSSTSTESDPNIRKPLNIKLNPLPTLSIPYISSAFTNDIKKAIKRSNSDIRLIHATSPKFTEESPRRIKALRQIMQGYREWHSQNIIRRIMRVKSQNLRQEY